MKVKVTTLTGDKYELEVAPQDTVKHVKKLLYEASGAANQVRLLKGQTVLEDDLRLCEYSLPEGATISALFEPDVNINIVVSIGDRTQKFTVSNAISVMAFKTQICGVFKHAVQIETMKLRWRDDIVDQNLPLHLYGITDGSKLEVIRPYVGVRIENNHGNKIYWRLYKKDTIKEVKVKLASAKSASSMDTKRTFSFHTFSNFESSMVKGTGEMSNEVNIDGVSVEGTYLYLITEDRRFNELDDDGTVENCKIKDGDNLYLLTYRWTQDEGDVFVMNTGSHIWGVEPGDTCLGIKLKVQDQTGIPASDLTLFNARGNQIKFYFERNRRKIGFADKSRLPQAKDARLVAITEEELQAEAVRMEEERKRKEWEHLETLAAKTGLTVEEYLAEQERKKKEAELENERRIQKQKLEAQLKRERLIQKQKDDQAQLEKEKQIQKQKDEQARNQEEARQKRMLSDAHKEYRKPEEVYISGLSRRRPKITSKTQNDILDGGTVDVNL